jgi:hypothetical protein
MTESRSSSGRSESEAIAGTSTETLQWKSWGFWSVHDLVGHYKQQQTKPVLVPSETLSVCLTGLSCVVTLLVSILFVSPSLGGTALPSALIMIVSQSAQSKGCMACLQVQCMI